MVPHRFLGLFAHTAQRVLRSMPPTEKELESAVPSEREDNQSSTEPQRRPDAVPGTSGHPSGDRIESPSGGDSGIMATFIPKNITCYCVLL